MPRKRLPARRTPERRTGRRTRQTRSNDAADDGIPDIYRDMLLEAARSQPSQNSALERVVKRRKISEEPASPRPASPGVESEKSSLFGSESDSHGGTIGQQQQQQIIYDEFGTSSEDSEADFEDVELEPAFEVEDDDDSQPEPKSLQINLAKPTSSNQQKKTISRRKPVSKAERDLRLDVHKWHVLCILSHLQCRNRWCESADIQAILKPLVLRKTISLLHVDESKPQYQRVHSFNNGIEEICATWRNEWTVSARGMRRAVWKEELDLESEVDDSEDLVGYEEFRDAAASKSGSRDLGAQLFCALLRSVAVDTRLVCSLQPLPFSGAAKGQPTPEKKKPHQNYIYGPAQSYQRENESTAGASASPSNPRWRVSEYASSTPPRKPKRESPAKRIRESPYPVFWVEVFSQAVMAWIPLDPLVRNTINKPKTGFEPPASDSLNAMSYVIAFDEDGSAIDVTRRYVQFYNAKTRKSRVESTKGGEEWWDGTMRVFKKAVHEDRDEIEETELTRRLAAEPMPRNVQDFKGHPVYVLERHLRRNEVIHPKREVGKVGTGTVKGTPGKLESVYRRRDVYFVRSSEQWYRRGRDVKAGEVGLKRLIATTMRGRAGNAVTVADEDSEFGEGEDDAGAMLYAEFQTEVYVPPPVVRGRIPKNAYGNLDVYVPSMIPAGAIHFQHPEAAKAARVLGIHYVDAVTGFSFKGRQGTAVINGVVVAAEYRDAMVEAVDAMEYERVKGEEERRSVMMLALWKRFLTALRIRKRVDEDYKDAGTRTKGQEEDTDDEENYSPGRADTEENESDVDGGGFMPDSMDVDDDGDDSTEHRLPEMDSSVVLLRPTEDITYHEIVIVESPHTIAPQAKTQNTDSHSNHNEDFSHREIGHEQNPGGFLFDDDDNDEVEEESNGFHYTAETAGGFILEADADAEADGEQGVGGGFILDDDGPDGNSREDVVQAHNTAAVDAAGDIPAVENTNNPSGPFAAIPEKSGNVHSEERGNGNKGEEDSDDEEAHDDEKSADNESLLSHDPDDDDMEPEWLA